MEASDHILKKITEECSEVIKEICKAELFGMQDYEPNQTLSNQEKIQNELADLLAVVEMACERGILFDYEIFNRYKIDSKKEKVMKWLRYSQELNITSPGM